MTGIRRLYTSLLVHTIAVSLPAASAANSLEVNNRFMLDRSTFLVDKAGFCVVSNSAFAMIQFSVALPVVFVVNFILFLVYICVDSIDSSYNNRAIVIVR